MKWHHTENKSERIDVECNQLNNLIDIVYLANLMINKLKIGYSGHSITKNPSDKFLRPFNLEEEDLIRSIEIKDNYEQTALLS